MTYLALKWLHLLGASVLLGTGAGIAFFAWFGDRQAVVTADIGLLRGILRLTVTADFVFTATAAALQPISGLALWRLAGGSCRSHLLRRWFALGVPAFIAVLVLYALMLWRW